MPEETSLTLESTVLETDSEIADSADPTTMIDTLPAETDDAIPVDIGETEDSAGIPLNTDVTLNPQQVEAGYQVIDGKIYAPGQEPGSSKDGIHYGGVPTSSDTGFVTFKAELPTGVHDDAYVNLINMNTYEEYQIVLYEANGWSTTVSLPDANYVMDTSGLVTDFNNRYWSDRLRFKVTAGSSTVQALLFNDSMVETSASVEDTEFESIKEATGETEETTITYETVSDSPIVKMNQKIPVWNTVILFLLVMIPLIAIAIYAAKKKKPRKGGFD